MRLTKGTVRNSKLAFKAAKAFFNEATENGWLNWSYKNVELDDYFMISDHGEVISILLYKNRYDYIQITGAWTNPQFRQKHYYSKLWQELIKYGKNNNKEMIKSGFHIANTVSEAMQISQGRTIKDNFFNKDFKSSYFYLNTDNQ